MIDASVDYQNDLLGPNGTPGTPVPNPGWNAAGNAERWWFTFQYGKSGNAGAEYGLFYHNGTSDTAPAFGRADNPGSNWVALKNVTSLPSADDFTTVMVDDIITGQAPRWFAVAPEGQTAYSGLTVLGTSEFDDFALYTQVVPVPPSALLLGSGLLGLALLGCRRKKC